MRCVGFVLAIWLVPAACGVAASPDSAVLTRLKNDLMFLAGDECEGRGTETQGILKAGQYVADSFKAAGLAPAGTEGYFQPFDIRGRAKLGTPNTCTLTGPKQQSLELTYGDDFTPIGLSGTGKVAGPVVFVGYGIHAPTLDYDDYAAIDVTGKIVVILRRTPRADQKGNKFDTADDNPAALLTKVNVAADKKAAAVVFVNDQGYAKKDDPLLAFSSMGPGVDLPVIHIKRAVLDKLLAGRETSLDEIETTIDKTLEPQSIALTGWDITLETTVDRNNIPTRNVVAVSEGAGPLAEETVVIGAHYDHLGFGEVGSLGGRDGKGKIHYGADDNGSGTVGLMELARRVGGMTNRQGRRIVFIAFAGEERGLFGSIEYCKNPTFPLDKTVFMVNMDMIGRVVEVPVDPKQPDSPKKDRVVVYGTGTAEGLDDLVEAVNSRLDFKLLKIPGGTGPSDHDSFYRKKIPVLFFFTGTHKDYHRPTDTPDKVNYAGLAKVLDFAELCVLKYATDPVRPKYVVTKGGWEDPTEERRRSPTANLPKLGIMPGNYEATEGGVLVEGLSPGGAAEKAGVKDQDVIVEIGGKRVKDIQEYMSAMQAQKAGVEVEVVVIRADKRLTLKLVPLP